MSEKKAFIVPGIGYTADRSLLYFTGKMAENAGYTRDVIGFGGFEKGVKGDPEKMKRAFRHAYNQLTEQLPEDAAEGDIFISKSIGTAVSLHADLKKGIRARHILFTPLAETMHELRLLLESQGSERAKDIIVFHGLKDPWAPDNEQLSEDAEECGVTYYQVTDANHSLETGEVMTDIGNLRGILEACGEFISGSH
jgi:phosphoglycolate phosphatase